MAENKAIKDFIAKYGDISKLEGNYYNGYLYLSGTGITSLPEGLTVGGSLDLSGTGITSLPEGLTVGGFLDLSGTGITDTSKVNRNLPEVLRWEYKGREYIKVDGIFSRVISRKGKVWRIAQIGSTKEQYLVTDGEGRYAHGDTIKQAKADLIYKIKDRNTDKYKGMALDTRLTFAEAIKCYRVITGACEAGTRGFVQSLGDKVKDHYTIAEMMEVTKGQYGNATFCNFFQK